MELAYLLVAFVVMLAVVFGVRLFRPTVNLSRHSVFGPAQGLSRFGIPYYAMAT